MPHFAEPQLSPPGDKSSATLAPPSTSAHTPPQRAADHPSSSAEQLLARRLRVQTRRRRYLELHPEYFSGADLKLAGA